MAEKTYAPRLIVTRDSEASRFELHRHEIGMSSELLSFADYSIDDDVMTLPYVETLFEHRNNDFAAMLMSGVLDEAQSRVWRIRPTCSYAASYITDNPDMRYLLAS